MTYLKPETKELLKRVGVREYRDGDFNYSLESLITDSEAMRLIFGDEWVNEDGRTEVEDLDWQKRCHEHSVGKNPPLPRFTDFEPDRFVDEQSKLEFMAHHLLDLCLSGDYEAAEQLLVEALERKE